MYYVLCITMNLIKTALCSAVLRKVAAMVNLSPFESTEGPIHKIIHKMGGCFGKVRAVDRKLKSHLEWPNIHNSIYVMLTKVSSVIQVVVVMSVETQ